MRSVAIAALNDRSVNTFFVVQNKFSAFVGRMLDLKGLFAMAFNTGFGTGN
jgi:hypothetical protein